MARDKKFSMYENGLEKNSANFVPLSPTAFLRRTADVFPDRIAVAYGSRTWTYKTFYQRAKRLASALSKRGFEKDDTIAILSPNTPAMLEVHYAVPMMGAVLNPLNIRLDAATIAFILKHGEAKVLLTDTEFHAQVSSALEMIGADILVIDIQDSEGPGGTPLGSIEYENFLLEGDADFDWKGPADEWQSLILSYTSGTTGDPKGVVYHHRGATINTLANVAVWEMPHNPVYLWTLPIFHSLGWCFPWTITLLAGTHVCLRRVSADQIFAAVARHDVTHMCGAPIVLSMLINATPDERQPLSKTVKIMTAASPPPASVIGAVEEMGFDILHVYGLTEVFGPAVVCEWQDIWESLSIEGLARMKSRQGVAYPTVEALDVVNGNDMIPVRRDGEQMGEVVIRANTVMKGYVKNEDATRKAFAGGWFHTGDLGVVHPDGYVELKDRSKDIIISGGENISSIEVEDVLYKHPAVMAAAVVARPDPKWGESPCAFIELKDGILAPSATEIISFCRERLAPFKVPKTVVFDVLPKTSTGKIQKFQLREKAKLV